ncbi:MAG: type II toxin-antitoxin system VapC family toxin [Bacteroidetes bacterium SB0662_bin_6]|nr:type II toxin-antitoxin system VapC family toxin [Bacteroidetes bacterium SB0668_bin_1]MYE03884.1 type II toxin-antitoxin system VapC family toxin [Bacteroidetes bacterium SB0662_bin_6]
MNRFVIDASIAIKWVVYEDDSLNALAILQNFPLSSPDLLIAECSNILWKKVKRAELTTDEAIMAAHLIQRADVELLPTRRLMDAATRLAIELDHAAYDCIYLALAIERDWPFVTADDRFRRKLAQVADARVSRIVLSIQEALAMQA